MEELVKHYSNRNGVVLSRAFSVKFVPLLVAGAMLAVSVLTAIVTDRSSGTTSSRDSLNMTVSREANTMPLQTQPKPPVARVAALAGSTGASKPLHKASRSEQRSLLGQFEAQSVFTSIWPRFVKDVETDNRDLLNVATAHVIGVVVGELECGCLLLSRSWTSYELTAPVQTNYPISFLVDVNNPTAYHVVKGVRSKLPFLTLVIFEKESANANWEISRIVGTGNTSPLLAPTDSESLKTTAGPSSFLFDRGFSQLVAAMDSARNTGRVPANNMWSRVGPHDQPGTILRELESDHKADLASKSPQVGGYTFSTPSAAFSTKLGYMECAYVLGTATYSGANYVQPANRSAYGPLLAPGKYMSLIIRSTRDACILSESSGFNSFIGIEGGTSSETGALVALS
jgi:hypothetical protein